MCHGLRVSQGPCLEAREEIEAAREDCTHHSKTCFAAGEGGWSVEDWNC